MAHSKHSLITTYDVLVLKQFSGGDRCREVITVQHEIQSVVRA